MNRFGLLLGRGILRLEVTGYENIPNEPVIVAANHSSYLDPALITVLFPHEIRFLAKRELFKNPLVLPFLLTYSSIPLTRGAPTVASFKRAVEALQGGISVGIFPEGTRSPKRLPAKPGLGFLVQLTGRKVLPVTLKGTDVALRELMKLRRAAVKVIFHEPMKFQIQGSSRERWREIGEEVLDVIYGV